MTLHDTDAEKALVGAALLDPRITHEVMLDPADLNDPRLETVWRTITDQPASPTILSARLRAAGEHQAAELLPELVTAADIPSNAPTLAGIVTDLAQRRRLDGIAARIHAAVQTDPAAQVVAATERELATIGARTDEDQPLGFREFLDLPLPDEEWVLDGYLARGERLVLTGIEGGGKSVFMRQLGVCAAAGLDPFDPHRRVPRARVMYLDLENRLRTMQPWMRKLDLQCRQHGGDYITSRDLVIKRKEDGLDLAGDKDTLMVARWVRDFRPDLLLIGPAYKAFLPSERDREEALVARLLRNLDRICAEVGCALVIEHHAPHAAPGAKQRDMRPIGSSIWMRWPEFGIGLRPTPDPTRTVEVTHWRGPRAERSWPEALSAGGAFPWSETVLGRG